MRCSVLKLCLVGLIIMLLTSCGKAPSTETEAGGDVIAESRTENPSDRETQEDKTEETETKENTTSALGASSNGGQTLSGGSQNPSSAFGSTAGTGTAQESTSDGRQEAWTDGKSIDEIIAGMSLEEKVGQMFIIRCPATGVVADVKEYHPGGFVLFARDFEKQTKDGIKKTIGAYQQSAGIKMLIAVDEEGGKVNRISKFSQFRDEPFLSPQALYRKGGWALIESDTKEKAALLKSLGVNLNLAPVCDVANEGSYIYERTFGPDAVLTSSYVEKVVKIMNDSRVGVTLKHFPGYGNNENTHTGIAYDKRPYSQFEKADFLPFIAGIKAGAGSVMVSHNIVTCMDPAYPASLSPEVHQILRNTLGFDGVIMTDDLSMDAIKEYTGGDSSRAAIQAIHAGNDLLCCTDYEVQIPAVINAVKSGEISMERIEESVRRILLWKRAMGLI